MIHKQFSRCVLNTLGFLKTSILAGNSGHLRLCSVIHTTNVVLDTTKLQAQKGKLPIGDENDFANDGDYFRYLIRNSKLINMGDPEGKVVIGTIFHVVQDDLYIDFGWKFYTVCPRPNKQCDLYVRNTKVYLRIKDLELSSRFLGSEKDLTILEADATIVGLASSPVKKEK